jgi:hypothetical protein
MNNNQQAYDGALISELGVKRFLKANKDIKISNIDFFIREGAANKAWKECNFGCHGPTYRNLKRAAKKSDFLKSLDNISPLLAGTVDGLYHNTVGQAERIGGGVKRTAEGLHIHGEENFQSVGDENVAAYQFATTAFEKLISFEIDLLENPVTQIVMVAVSEYISVLPEWLIEETLRSGALKIPNKIDTPWLLKAAALGVIENTNQEHIIQAINLLNQPAQRLLGKQIGKKLAVAIAVAIASTITKKIMRESPALYELKRKLVSVRKTAKTMKGGLGGAMLTLLKSQGLLNIAAEASRRLNNDSPRVWNRLRFRLNGANMVYFLVENMVSEYIDRLAVLERNPEEFGKILEALIKAKQTPQIFFPGTQM